MEESSERRRERLRVLREEASIGSNDEEGSCVTTSPPDAPGLPLPSDLLQLPALASPLPRFEFYTDPLAAYSGSQKKKPKNRLHSPFGGPSAAALSKSPPSPFWQPDFSNLNPNLRPPGNLNPLGLPCPSANLPPAGGFSTPSPSNPNPHPNPHHASTVKFHPGGFNTPNSTATRNSYSSPHQSSITSMFTSPGSFSTPGSADFNTDETPQGAFSNPGSSSHRPQSGFGSPQPLSASQMYNGGGSGGLSMNTPLPYRYNRGRGGFSADSPPQHRMGGTNDMRNSGWSQNNMDSGQSQGSNRSRGSFMQSPGSTGRDNRTPGRSGSRGFQRGNSEVSALTNPELFFKRSMLSDPWRDLKPVRFGSLASHLDAFSVMGSRDWLPKSINKVIRSPTTKGVTVSASGPSLAECLAASYTDAVLGEDGA